MSKIKDRIGEEKFNNKGLKMKIVAYRSAVDIDVLFLKSRITVKNKTYNSFKNGEIAEKVNRIGEEKINNKGLKMKIVAYRKYTDIDVLFIEEDILIEHRTYDEFTKGTISLPLNRVGEVKINKQGLKMKIVTYRKYTDIDVLFIEKNILVEHREYSRFKDGSIMCKSVSSPTKIDRTGEIGTNSKGLRMEVIAYRNCEDIDILFPKYNIVVTNKRYRNFKLGSINCPFNERIGEIRLNNNGEEMKIITYHNSNDIDILFTEYNLKVEHERYKHFVDGSISRPTYVVIDNEQYIVCGGYCKRVLKANKLNFRKNSELKLGLDTICKKCIKEKEKQYREDNPHVQINKRAKRRCREENQGRGILKYQYYELMDFFCWKCAYTGDDLNRYKIEFSITEYNKLKSVDHIIPLTHYGLHEPWNLVPCKYNINSLKNSNKDWIKWYRSQEFYSEERENKILNWISYAWQTYGETKEFREYSKNKWYIEIDSFIDRLPLNIVKDEN